MNCLQGCVGNFLSGPVQIPLDGNSLGPWVRVYFAGGEGQSISVGNQSSPGFDNHAIIKSFDFGESNGITAKVEIIDEEGGAFQQFVDRMLKCMKDASKSYTMKAQFGWVVGNCDGTTSTTSSPILTFCLTNLEISLSEGKVKFTIHANDLLQAVFVSREDKNFGTDDNPMRVKDAIEQLMEGEEPKINVEYFRKSPSGSISTFDFDPEFGSRGPKAVWPSDGQNKLNTIMKWLEPFMTDRRKGMTATWDTDSPDPTLIVWESLDPDCRNQVTNSRIIGTYIVNGGGCSNVISFNPNINWVAAFGASKTTGGDAGGAATGETAQKTPATSECATQTKNTGLLQKIPIANFAMQAYGPAEVLKKTNAAQSGNATANAIHSGVIQPVEAELRIQGDPSYQFCSLKDWKGKYVAIVVINPFHLADTGDGGCGDWLAEPPCNNVLSNRNWMVMGVSHQIKEGSYTTILKVRLPSPGVDLPAGGPLGGPGSGGYTPQDTC